ncbi:MAG TPA: trypsin-like peptidase domain-containing protein [Streptosporangiaceae bacterium]|nr:trypsin-like peptidase domain-containing protein [Streptosporangiaceae bacterium]
MRPTTPPALPSVHALLALARVLAVSCALAAATGTAATGTAGPALAGPSPASPAAASPAAASPAAAMSGARGRAAHTALERGHRAGWWDLGQQAGQQRYAAHRAALSMAALGITEHSAAVTPAEQARAVRYWTTARMAAARPAVAPRDSAAGASTYRAPRDSTAGASTHPAPRASASTHSTATDSAATDSAATDSAATGGAWTEGSARDRGNTPVSAVAAVPAHPPAAAPALVAEPRPAAIRSNTAAAGWPGGGAVGRTTGKVFFTMDAQDYVCSGAVVASANADVVITAAHCVKNGTGSWAVNWTFVPGFAQGSRPYGSWTAQHFFVAPQWSRAANDNDDVAFVTLNPRHSGRRISRIGRVVGSQPIKFGQRTAEEFAFGYPAEPPYNGAGLFYCSGRVTGDHFHASQDSGLRCQMTAGSSGGPWLSGFDPATGTGTITSVSSFKYSADPSTLYAPPLGAVARALFRQAARS